MTETQNPDARPAPYAAAPAARGNAAGTVALVVGLVLVVIGLVQQVVNYFVPQILADTGASVVSYAAVNGVVAVITGLLALVGIITGILGIQPSRTGGRLAAAAGLAISAAHLLSVLVGFVMAGVLSVL